MTTAAAADTGSPRPAPGAPRPVALLLPGQGSQHRAMAAGLHPHEPVFAEAFDEVLDAMGRHGAMMRADWLAADRPEVPLDHVLRSQPLLFAVDFALGRLVMSWGVRPVALLGHSIGELAAAALAGVFPVRDAARVVLDRVVRLADSPPGGMLAVAATPERLAPYLGGQVAVGAVNAPGQTILSGPGDELRAVGERLRADGLVFRPVPALSAFHSPALAPYAKGAERLLAAVPRRPPATPVYSGYTAAPLTAEQATSPEFWARQPVDPVWFWSALGALLETGGRVLVEAGPGQGLAAVARRHTAVRRGHSRVVALLPARPSGPDADRAALAAAKDELRNEGYDIP
ncbi:acyltransferase domain-containing protein [Streptomyces sp. NPDC057654]|uniref:acyltransferase domain-containing protein n=1 Tax=Streptomyces sp. NPDC057654 TaxID=3346196 RepID=UPI003676F77C